MRWQWIVLLLFCVCDIRKVRAIQTICCDICTESKFDDYLKNWYTGYADDGQANYNIASYQCLQMGCSTVPSTCKSGEILTCKRTFYSNTPITCESCPAGSYALDFYSCTACTVCKAPKQRVKSECRSNQNAECEACPVGYVSTGDNQGVCAFCDNGWWYGGLKCVACTDSSAGCLTSQWIKCEGGTRVCVTCTGHLNAASSCPAGKGIATECSGTTLNNAVCQDCGPGKERPEGTPMVDGYQQCLKCGTGKYKVGTSTAACQNCTNKPALNSVYRAWTLTEAADTASCPWNCNAGYYNPGTSSSCVPCPAGTYQDAVGASVCKQCANGSRTNSYFLQRASGVVSTADNCPWDCNAGYKKNLLGTNCEACPAGFYREASSNRLVDEGLANTCSACPTCVSGVTYQTRACTTTLQTGCSACRTACGSGQYISSACTPLVNTGCANCTTSCPVDSRRSQLATCSGNKDFDEVLAACVACRTVADCASGFYLNWRCLGTETVSNECKQCTVRACGADQYASGCSEYADTQCLPYTVCASGYYLADESRTKDGVCRQCTSCGELQTLVPCSKYNNVVCKGNSCGQYTSCPTRTDQNRSGYFCYYGAGTGKEFCGVCPAGYNSDGQYCVECPRGSTCNRVGEVECRGQCGAGVSSRCETIWDFLGYAVCDSLCALPAPDTRIPWRGSYVRAGAEDCATYFDCVVGHYKDFSPGGSIECKPCVGLLGGDGQYTRWETGGLSVGDETSCLWECKRELAVQTRDPGATWPTCTPRGWTTQPATNAAGMWAGVEPGVGGSCGIGRTSEVKSAMSPEECVDCPGLVPNVQGWASWSGDCDWRCTRETDEQLGGSCVTRRYNCKQAGLSRVVGATFCETTSFPWNRPGYAKIGVIGPNLMNGTAQVAVVSSGQAVTFASRPWGLTGRHTVSTSGYATKTVQGGLCSAARATIGGREYVLGALCNQSFLVFLDLGSAGNSLGVLAGNASQRGWRDGFRTQALFESELHVAWGGESLFVLDRWNCLMREVVVWPMPGDYRTRVYTLWGVKDDFLLQSTPQPRCVGLGALAWPRRWWQLEDDGENGWLAFSDEDGLWQMHATTKELRVILQESAGGFESDEVELVWLSEDKFTLFLRFFDGRVWTVTAEEEACPDGYTSLAGGECSEECPWKDLQGVPSKYVDGSTGLCLACTGGLSCGVGFEGVSCSARANGYCKACAVVPGYRYVLAGTCSATVMRSMVPCGAGSYEMDGSGYCEVCPSFTSTRFAGAYRREQCKCLDGLERDENGTCVGEALYSYDAQVCSKVGACQVPGNAQLLPAGYGGESCKWACNAGYYRDRKAGLAGQCRACLSGEARTRGDHDSPWSCE